MGLVVQSKVVDSWTRIFVSTAFVVELEKLAGISVHPVPTLARFGHADSASASWIEGYSRAHCQWLTIEVKSRGICQG